MRLIYLKNSTFLVSKQLFSGHSSKQNIAHCVCITARKSNALENRQPQISTITKTQVKH